MESTIQNTLAAVEEAREMLLRECDHLTARMIVLQHWIDECNRVLDEAE